jgi:hypothetical protein
MQVPELLRGLEWTDQVTQDKLLVNFMMRIALYTRRYPNVAGRTWIYKQFDYKQTMYMRQWQ